MHETKPVCEMKKQYKQINRTLFIIHVTFKNGFKQICDISQGKLS